MRELNRISGIKNSEWFFSLAKSYRANCTFNIFIGGRGTGKTYGCLSDIYKNYNKFIYMRRTEAQIATIIDEDGNPFESLNSDFGLNVTVDFSNKTASGKFIENEKTLGVAMCLSTFYKMKGADLTTCDIMLYDEFMKMRNERPIKDEAGAFFGSYETINRNREIAGCPPLKVYMCSNSTSLDSPILVTLGLVPIIEKMMRDGQTSYTDKSKDLHLELLKDLPISEMKKETAIGKLTRGTDYYNHAFNNEFSYDSFENIRKENLRNYLPFIQVDNIFIYTHKTTARLHACQSKARCKYVYDGDSIPLFKRLWGMRVLALMQNGTMTFSDFMTKSTLFNMF